MGVEIADRLDSGSSVSNNSGSKRSLVSRRALGKLLQAPRTPDPQARPRRHDPSKEERETDGEVHGAD